MDIFSVDPFLFLFDNSIARIFINGGSICKGGLLMMELDSSLFCSRWKDWRFSFMRQLSVHKYILLGKYCLFRQSWKLLEWSSGWRITGCGGVSDSPLQTWERKAMIYGNPFEEIYQPRAHLEFKGRQLFYHNMNDNPEARLAFVKCSLFAGRLYYKKSYGRTTWLQTDKIRCIKLSVVWSCAQSWK